MHRPYPRAERLIAQAIGVPPETIWPARYAERGKDSTRRGANPRRQEAA
jgi:Ner family transcriptional regulator